MSTVVHDVRRQPADRPPPRSRATSAGRGRRCCSSSAGFVALSPGPRDHRRRRHHLVGHARAPR